MSRNVTGDELVTRRIRKLGEELAVEPESPVAETVSLEQSAAIEYEEPMNMVTEPVRKPLDYGQFVVEPAEPVLAFRGVVNLSRSNEGRTSWFV